MSQYLDTAGLETLVTKTKEYARKSAKDAVNPDSAGASKTITGWNASAAVYGDIEIAESQVTGLVNDLAAKAPLNSPAFSGIPTVPNVDVTVAGSQQIANTKYVKDLVGNIGEAMHYKRAVTQSQGLPETDYVAGDTYKVAEAGTYAGKTCEVGDMIIANKTYASGTASNDDWDVIQTNIDGAVTGPGSSVSGNFAIFNGTTGKVIMDAGYGLDHFKTVQTTAAFNGDDLQTIQTITQNENGEIGVTFQDIQTASTSQAGVVQLQGSIGASESEDGKAATPKSVRDAINGLDVTAITVGASKTLASISEVDGKIQTEAVDIQIAKNQVTDLVADLGYIATSAATLDAKIDAVSGAVDNLDANVTSTNGKNVQIQVVEANGVITAVNVTTDNTVNATDVSNAINTAIEALDAPVSAIAPSATITSIAETDGKIAITSGAIEITTRQITDFQAVLDGKADKKVPATAGNIATLDASGNLADAGYGIDHFKTVQTAVNDPTASGNDVEFIATIEQDTNGVITATKKTVQNADGSNNGLMSSEDYTKLHNMSVSSVNVTNAGVLEINGTSAMGPISTDAITGLFSEL